MDTPLSPELEDLRGKARALVDTVLLPLEHSLVENKLTPSDLADVQEAAKKIGLWQYDVPVEFGGQGHGLEASCVVEEELGKTKGSPFRGNTILGPTVRPILYGLDDSQKEDYLHPVLRGEKRTCFAQSEPGAGSDPRAMTTTAVLDGDHYVINGRKRWIGHAGEADFAQVVCRTGTDERGRAILSVILVDMDTPGVELVRQWMTITGDAPWEISFTDVRVPRRNLVNEEGEGMRLAQEWITRNRIAKQGARSIGMATRAFEMAIGFARHRETFGKPLADRQAVQFMIADSAIELHNARLLVRDAARRFDAGEDIRDLSYMVKIYATEVSYDVVDRALQIHGGLGLSVDEPLEYFFRQLRSIRITEGATEVLRWTLGKRVIQTTPTDRWPLPQD